MNARFALLSRLSIVPLALASATLVAACNGRASTSAPAPAAPVAEATQAEAAPAARSEHAPGGWMFRQVQALDLRAEQRASLQEIQLNLKADLAPHREELRQLTTTLADALEAGHLDAADAAAHQAALQATVADMKEAVATAMNAVHDTLDADQRAALVKRLDEQRRGHAHDEVDAPHDNGPLAKLAIQIGLTEEQKAALKDAMQGALDDIVPDRKARREAAEARMQAMADAFVSDDFDAADFDPGSHADEAIASFTEAATRAIDISQRVLSASQRQALAALIRERAQKI